MNVIIYAWFGVQHFPALEDMVNYNRHFEKNYLILSITHGVLIHPAPRVHNSTVLKRLLKKLLELLQYYWYCIAIDIAGIISKILISTLKLQLGKYHIDIEVDIEDNKFDYQ